MPIGERLTELRKSRGLSQEELAEQLTLTRQTISKWELGQSSPDIEYVIALCELFGVSTDYLLKGEEPEPKAKEDRAPVSAPVPPREDRQKSWMIFGLGMALSSIALVAIVIFVVLSVLHPWTTIMPGGKTYTGLIGYLLGTGSMPWFITAAALLVIGLGVAVFGIVRKPRQERERNAAG